MSYEEFRRRIDTARQILVGAVPSPAGQIDQITYALMYKFMNDIDDKSAALPGGKRVYFIGDYEQYNWHRLMDASLGAHERLELYRNAIQTMAKNENIPELFRSIYQNAFLPFNSPTVLNLFLKEMDKFNHGESDDIGDAYEYLLSITGAQGDVGQFRTPRHIIKFIVEAVNPTKDDKVLDPAVGTAGFLIAAYNHVKSQHDGKDESGNHNDEKHLTADEWDKIYHNYRGFDIDPTMVRTAKVNMYLHGFKTPDIINHDSLSQEDYWDDRYDVILANPPFMSPKGGIQPHKKFGITANRAEVLFVDYIASHLKPSGRAGIIVPEGVIFQSGKAYKELRRNLIENYLYAVVSLPSGVFMPYTGVKTSILLLDKDIAAKNKEVLFLDIKHTGISLGATGRPIAENDLPQALIDIRGFKDEEPLNSLISFSVSREEIRDTQTFSLQANLYKSTHVYNGDHSFVSLGEVATVHKGKSSSTKTDPGRYPLYLTAAETKSSNNYDFDGDGVAVPLISALGHGKADIKRVHRVTGQFALANLLCYVKPDEDKLDSDYLYYILDSAKSKLASLMSGAANVSMNVRDVESFNIPLPPLEIQREIVAELDSYQKIIDAAQTIVKTHKPTIKINPDWKMIQIGKAFKTSSGGTPSKSKPEYYTDGTIPWLGSGEVAQGIIKESKNKISELALKESSAKIFPVDSVLIAMYGATVGQVGILKFESSTNQAVCAILPNNHIAVPEFIYSIMKSHKEDLIRLSTGGAQPNISQQIIRNFQIPLPPIEIQREIVAELEAEQKLIDANKKLIEIYQQKVKSKIAEVWGE